MKGGLKLVTENDKLDLILNKIETVRLDLESVKYDLETKIETEIKSVRQDLSDEIKSVRQDLSDEIKSVRQDLGDEIKSVKYNLKAEITAIKLTLENVTNKNIQIIAEGHLDLSRKLDDALGSERDNKMIKIKLNILEHDVMQLKERPIPLQM